MPVFEMTSGAVYKGHTVRDWNVLRHARMQTLDIHQRPFAIDRATAVARLGGIFDTSQGRQHIGVYITYHLDPTDEIPLGRMGYHCELEADPVSGIVLEPSQSATEICYLPASPPGNFSFGNDRPVLRIFAADFSSAKPGKHRLVFKFHAIHKTAPGGPELWATEPEQIIVKTIFVMETTLSQSENAAVAELPEGRLVMRHNKVGVFPWMPWDKWLKYSPTVSALDGPSHPPLYVPIDITAEFYPATPFENQLGVLPFGDPVWWKWVLGFLAAIFAVLAALLGGAAKDAGGVWICSEDEGVGGKASKECTIVGPDDAVTKGGLGVLAGIIAAWCIQKALKDEKDPFRLGEERTEVQTGEITVKEEINAVLDYKTFLPASGPTVIGVDWTFRRFTQGAGNVGGQKIHEASDNWEVSRTPLTVSAAVGKEAFPQFEPVTITAEIIGEDQNITGGDVYVVAWLFGPKEGFRALTMEDRGDGVFSATTAFDSIESVGTWAVHILVQSIDQAREYDDPLVKAAGDKGGVLLNDALRRKDTKDCQFEFVKHSTFKIELPRVM